MNDKLYRCTKMILEVLKDGKRIIILNVREAEFEKTPPQKCGKNRYHIVANLFSNETPTALKFLDELVRLQMKEGQPTFRKSTSRLDYLNSQTIPRHYSSDISLTDFIWEPQDSQRGIFLTDVIILLMENGYEVRQCEPIEQTELENPS